jgi:hypothetical protein
MRPLDQFGLATPDLIEFKKANFLNYKLSKITPFVGTKKSNLLDFQVFFSIELKNVWFPCEKRY